MVVNAMKLWDKLGISYPEYKKMEAYEAYIAHEVIDRLEQLKGSD